ncbi:hypothetical protein EI94DRAFT_1721319 [Lactarius quietus]|nr:hypothetical protein EI94DRAFT_1721319 [Lactarius quietus]
MRAWVQYANYYVNLAQLSVTTNRKRMFQRRKKFKRPHTRGLCCGSKPQDSTHTRCRRTRRTRTRCTTGMARENVEAFPDRARFGFGKVIIKVLTRLSLGSMGTSLVTSDPVLNPLSQKALERYTLLGSTTRERKKKVTRNRCIVEGWFDH